MSAREQIIGKKIIALNNLYTAIIAFAFGLMLDTVIFVTLNCYFKYGTIFKIP